MILAGMPAVGRPLRDICFRIEEAEKLLLETGTVGDMLCPDLVLTPGLAGHLLESGYVQPLKKKFPGGSTDDPAEPDRGQESSGRNAGIYQCTGIRKTL